MKAQVEMEFRYERDRYPCHVRLTLRLPLDDADLWYAPLESVFYRPLSISRADDYGEVWEAQVEVSALSWEEALEKAKKECEEAVNTLRQVVERNRALIASTPPTKVLEYDL